MLVELGMFGKFLFNTQDPALKSNPVNMCLAVGTFLIFNPVFDNTKAEPLNQKVIAAVAESVFPSLTSNITLVYIA